MKTGFPWRVTGVGPQARETAREAARRSGMSVGEWLDTAIIDSALEEGVEPVPHRVRNGRADGGRHDDTLDEQLAEMKHRIESLTRQLDATPHRPTQPASNNGKPRPPRPTSRPPAAERDSVDQAMAEIAQRQRALDGRVPSKPEPARAPTQNFAGLERQLREITTRMETLQPCGIDEAVETLRSDLAEIGLMVKEAMPRQAIEALEAEMRGLADRIEGKREGGEAALAASVERNFAEIRAAVSSLTPAENLAGLDETLRALANKIDHLASGTQNGNAVQQIETAIAGLRSVLAHVASTDAIAKLSDDVRQLAAKVEQAPGPGFLTTLQEHVAAIADALQRRHEQGHSAPELDAIIRGLTDKLEKLQLSRGDHIAVTQLEDRIVSLAEKLDASDARLNHLEAIEHALAELLVHFEKERKSGSSAAPAVPEVNSLKQEMLRTQDSLEAVHGTLGHVVDRLVMIENGISGPVAPPAEIPDAGFSTTEAHYTARALASALRSDAAPEAAPVTATRPNVNASPDPDPDPVFPPMTSASAPPNGNPAPAAARRPIDPSLPPDHPIEPGIGRNRTGGSAAERIAASEAALRPGRPPVIEDPGGKSNFIAAARRAAQVAGGDMAARERGEKLEKIGVGGSLGSRIASRIRSFLVAASVVIIVLGSLQLVMNLFGLRHESEEEQHTGSISPAVREDETPRIITTPAPPPEGSVRDEPVSAVPSTAPAQQQATSPSGVAPLAVPSTSLLLPLPPGRPFVSPEVKPVLPAEKEPVVTGSAKPTGAMTPSRPPEPPKRSGASPAAPGPAADTLPASLGSEGLRAAAVKGDPTAQYEIGIRFAEGRGIPQDFKAAADWFERAGKQGLAPAQFRLAVLYEKGTGVRKDLQSARRLYFAAGQAGNGKALHNLAVLYAEGIDGKPDYATAAKWFRKAADYGITDSQYNLGVLYAGGVGVEANLAEAYKWLELAGRRGDKEALAKRDEIGTRLDQRTLAAARAAADGWNPEPQPELAIEVKPPQGGWDAPVAPLKMKRRTDVKGGATMRLAQ